MLVIRREQIDTFVRAAVDEFVARTVARFTARDPDGVARRGSDTVEPLVREAIARADVLGLERPIDVARYVTLAYLLGVGFEDDPRYAWARTALDDERVPRQSRMAVVCAHAEHELGAALARLG